VRSRRLDTRRGKRGEQTMTIVVASIAALLAALGCKARSVPSVDSNTNWLKVCDVDDDCSPADTCQRRACVPIASASSGVSPDTSAETEPRTGAEEPDAGTTETPPTCFETCTEAGGDAETCRARCANDVAVADPVERPVTDSTDTATDSTATDVTDSTPTTDTTTRPSDTTTTDVRPSDTTTDATGSTTTDATGSTDAPSSDVPPADTGDPPADAPPTCYVACVAGGSEATCRERCVDAADATRCVDDCTLGSSEATCRERCTSLSCYDSCLDAGERDATCRERCITTTSSATCREDCIDGGAEPASCDRYCASTTTGTAGAPSR